MQLLTAPLPTLPLWLAMLIALGSEAMLVAGLAQWPERRERLSAEVPIEVSLVAVPMLADSAVSPDRKPLATASAAAVSPVSESKSEPEPKPHPAPLRAPDATPPAVALDPPKPKSKPVLRPKAKSKPTSKPKPSAKAKRPKPHSPPTRAASANRSQAATTSSSTPSTAANAARAAVSTPDRSPVAYANNPAPSYPDAARRLRQEGTVYLRVLVSASGHASQVLIADSSGVSSLDQAALRTVRRWRFKPAQQHGQPTSAWVRVPVRFKLNR